LTNTEQFAILVITMQLNWNARYRISLETRNGHEYYYATRSYRQKIEKTSLQQSSMSRSKIKGSGKSKVVHEKKYLGTSQTILQKLFQSEKVEKISSKEYGLPMAIYQLAQDIGLMEIMDEALPYQVKGIKASEFILISTISKLQGSISKEKTGDYFSGTVLPGVMGISAKDLNSKSYWSIFEKIISEKDLKSKKREKQKALNDKLNIEDLEELIDDQKLETIEERVWKNLLQKYNLLLDILLCDGTNYFTYYQDHTRNSLGQKGKNKKGRHQLRQIALFLAVTGDGFPFLSQLACGQQHDATMFPTAMTKMIQRYHGVMKDAEKIKMAFDKGNNSKKNLQLIAKHEYVGSLSPSQQPHLADIALEAYTQKYKDFNVYEGEEAVFGQAHKIFMTYNSALYHKQRQSFFKQKDKAIFLLREMFEKHKNADTISEQLNQVLHENKILHSRAARYLSYEIESDQLKIIEDADSIEKKTKAFGKNIIFTNNLNANCQDTVGAYKEKQKVEDSFRTLKDHRIISMHPLWHWTDSKIRMDAFISVLAYLLIKLLQYLADQAGLKMSVASLITALEGIREVFLVYPDKTAEKRLEDQPPLQQQLLAAFGLPSSG